MARTPEQLRELMKQCQCDSLQEAVQLDRMWERRARKCIKVGWRTIEPPEMIDYGAFTEVWTAIEKKLRANPGVQVGRLLDGLIVEYPGKFRRSQLRTLQRYVRDWLFLYGPDKEVFFQQKDGTVI